jgi:hypothetical protein
MSPQRAKISINQVERKTEMKIKHLAAILMSSILLVTASNSAYSAEISVKSVPPSVAKTVPQCGDTAVDPALNEIRITFSKDMMTKEMWSISEISKEAWPEITGEVHFDKDKRTFVLPVKLEPGKTYGLWINKPPLNNFRDAQGKPAFTYLLIFQTRK